jgi:hypothetical protein
VNTEQTNDADDDNASDTSLPLLEAALVASQSNAHAVEEQSKANPTPRARAAKKKTNPVESGSEVDTNDVDDENETDAEDAAALTPRSPSKRRKLHKRVGLADDESVSAAEEQSSSSSSDDDQTPSSKKRASATTPKKTTTIKPKAGAPPPLVLNSTSARPLYACPFLHCTNTNSAELGMIYHIATHYVDDIFVGMWRDGVVGVRLTYSSVA